MRTQKLFVILLTSFICATFISATRAADRPSDETINYWVKEALRGDPRVDVSDVKVETHDGIVTLTGSTNNVAEKNYADLESKKIKGVRGVINELKIAPSNRFDSDITQDIRHRIVFNAVINSYNPHDLGVFVQDGHVTLTGEVNSWDEWKEVELVAGEVRGVKSVTNDLKVNYKPRRSDLDIEKDVIAALYRDEYLTGLPITVSVKNGTVSLTGEVGNAYQKEHATEDATFVDNVKNIENNIDVKWWKERGTRESAPLPSDEQLKQTVRDELYQDIRVNPFDISVTASYGHITLRGTVPNYPQKQTAERDAREVVGVAWVSNLLSVRNLRREDAGIQRDVEMAFDSDYSLNGQDIRVHVKDGIVNLSGNVNQYSEKYRAEDVAGKILGVLKVANNIVVNTYPKYTDAALRDRIKDRLFSNWETGWVSDRINVEIVDGKVTLTGNVFTWSERDEAGRIAALTDGVYSVNNLLIVDDTNYPWGEWHDTWLYMP